MWSPTGKALVGADEAATLDALVGRGEVLHELTATHGGRRALSRASWMKRLIYLSVAAAVVFVVSIGETAARPKFAGPAKKIVVLHSYDRNFEPGFSWGNEIRKELSRQSRSLLEIQEFSLVTARGGNDAAEAKFVEYLRALYPRTTARFDRRYRCACGSLRSETQGRPVSDNADAARGSRTAPS